MSTTSLTAAEVMDRSAQFMNDPLKTDYTYAVQLPYLNTAIDELIEALEESNSSPTNKTSPIIPIPVGVTKITSIDDAVPGVPTYPTDLVEIQGVVERGSSNEPFITMTKKEFLLAYPASQALIYWSWEDQEIKFNPNGATTPREVQIQYVRQAVTPATDETTVIGTINARSYLAYKTAALCSMFIGENETRASALNDQAEKAMERLLGINNKGRQAIVTRHRPFRAAWKVRGGFYRGGGY